MPTFAFPLLAASIMMAAVLATSSVARADKQANYYYPKPQTSEVYNARAETMPDSSRGRRLGFVNVFANKMLSNPYPPNFALFAKGTEAEKMIIVSLQAGMYDTLYRMRGLLALLTSQARSTEFFRDRGVDEIFTFFDLAKMLGFETITVSDGDNFAHRVELK